MDMQQALTTQVWQGAATGVPVPTRLWPDIDELTYRWAVAMVRFTQLMQQQQQKQCAGRVPMYV